MLSAQNISYQVKHQYLVQEVHCTIMPGEFVVVMGANGAGKSTLMKMLSGALVPSSGVIHLHNQLIQQYSLQQLATLRGVLSQQYHFAFPLTVLDVVQMGLFPFKNKLSHQEQQYVIQEALTSMQVAILQTRMYHTLSGGEAQKVQMCRVLAQMNAMPAKQPKLLFLDEPVASLDIKYQHQLLHTAQQFAAAGNAVFAVLHDINLALQYASKIYFMKAGKIVYDAFTPEKVQASIIKEVFDVDVTLVYNQYEQQRVVF